MSIKKVGLIFVVLVVLNILSPIAQAGGLIEPKMLENKTNAIVGWKQYLLMDSEDKIGAIMKDQYNEHPMVSLKEGDNYVTALSDSVAAPESARIIEYTKYGLVGFTDKGIEIMVSPDERVSISYPDKRVFTNGDNVSFYRFVQTASDGSDVFFVMEGSLYQLSARDKRITYLTALKDFKYDMSGLNIVCSPGSDYKLISISEVYGEPHLGFQGHSILIKGSKLVNYWQNSSYAGGNVLPAYLAQDQVVAAEDGQLAVYSLPSLQHKGYPANTSGAGVVFANHDYAVISLNEECILEVLDLKTGESIKPYKLLYTDAQRDMVEENDELLQRGDFLQFVSLEGDEVVFELENAYLLDPPGDSNSYAKTPVNRYTLNLETLEVSLERVAKEAGGMSKNPLVNALGLNMQAEETMESLALYQGGKLIRTIPYPRKYLGISVADQMRRTFYIENVKTGNKKESLFVIRTQDTANFSEKLERIVLPPDCFDTILEEALLAQTYGSNTFLATQDRIYQIAGGKITKTTDIPRILKCSAGAESLYLFAEDNAYAFDAAGAGVGKVKPLGEGNYPRIRINHLHPVALAEASREIMQVEGAYQKEVAAGEVFKLLFPFADDYFYVESVFNDGSKAFCLIMGQKVFDLPASLNDKDFFVYQSTDKQYLTPIRKNYKLTVTMEDADWEYTYLIEYPLVVTETEAKVFYQGKEIMLPSYPVMQNGSLLVPIQRVAEALGLVYAFDQSSGQMSIKKDNLEMVMGLNDNTANINHETFELNSPAIMLDGELMAPLRFICDRFGYGVRLEYYDYAEMPGLDVSRISRVYLE